MSVSRHIPIAVCGVAVLLAVLMAPVPLDDPNGGKGIGRVRLAKLPRLGEPARFGLPQANEPLGQESQPEPLPQQQEAVQPSAVATLRTRSTMAEGSADPFDSWSMWASLDVGPDRGESRRRAVI